MYFGYCTTCGEGCDGKVDRHGSFYCNPCFRDVKVSYHRSLTYATVYDMDTGEKLSSADSLEMCAERSALWKLSPDTDAIPKLMVVERWYKKKKQRHTHKSKPCMQCRCAMHLFNVQTVVYSSGKNEQRKVSLDDLSDDEYSTQNMSIFKVV